MGRGRKPAVKTFVEDDSLAGLANKVIERNKLDYLNQVRIRYVLIDPQISKTCVGKCIKASKELKYFGELDYVIEFSKDVWDKIDVKTKEIVMYHELLHILIKTNNKGELTTKILDHDVRDFSTIIKKYGVDWLNNFKTIVSSVRDLDDTKVDNIKV